MQRLSGYSRQHLDRLIAQYRQTKSLAPQVRAKKSYPYHLIQTPWEKVQ